MKLRIFVASTLILILTVLVDARTKPVIYPTKQDKEMALEYGYKAIQYSLMWNQLEQRFKVVEDVSDFKHLERKYHSACCLIDVTLRDGISFFRGLHNFHAMQYLDVQPDYDTRKLVIIELATKQIIWRTN